MSTHKIATSTLWQLTSQAITMVIGILGIKLTIKVFIRELENNYQTVYSYLQIFGILADFGLYAVSLRELSRATDRALTFGTLFLLRAVITCISLGVAIVFAWVLPSFRGTPLPLGITIAALVPFFTLLAGMFRTLFQVEYRMHFVFVSEVLGKIAPVLLMAGGVFLRGKGGGSARERGEEPGEGEGEGEGNKGDESAKEKECPKGERPISRTGKFAEGDCVETKVSKDSEDLEIGVHGLIVANEFPAERYGCEFDPENPYTHRDGLGGELPESRSCDFVGGHQK